MHDEYMFIVLENDIYPDAIVILHICVDTSWEFLIEANSTRA